MRHCLTCCPVTSRLLLASLLVSLLTAPAMVRQENTPQAVRQLDTPFDVLHVPDLIYATVEGKKELQLDLARPANGTGPFPAVIVLPGGGWVACDRKASLPVIHKLAEEGFVAVCINYRCAPDSPCPAAIHDAKCAVRWLRANAAQYQIDPNHIAALGYSAGGHLACILGTTTAPELEGNGGHAGYSSRVQAVVSFYGILDLVQLHEDHRRGELPWMEGAFVNLALKSFVAGPAATRIERMRQVSPIEYVSAATPPTLLLHGTSDTVVPPRQSRRYEERLKQAGVECRLVPVPDAQHNFDAVSNGLAQREVLAFLHKQLQPGQQTVWGR